MLDAAHWKRNLAEYEGFAEFEDAAIDELRELAGELLRDIEKLERNRSRFITQAVEHELLRRRREELLRSLQHPHPDAVGIADAGFGEWAASLPEEVENLVDPDEGKPVRWIEGKGWVEGPA